MRKLLFQIQCLCPVLFALAAVGFTACKNKAPQSPQGYSLARPYRTELGKALNEVSGVFYSPEDSSLFAISDSKDKIFQLNLKTKKLKDYANNVVEGNSDLEDIVKADNSFFLLKSKGILVEVPQTATDSASIKTYDLGLPGVNDFETLYHDPSLQSLVLLCKTCAHEKGTGLRTAYRFDLRSRSFDSSAFYTISRPEIKRLLKDANADFEPSAAAINPINRRLFILASAGKLLVVTDTRGQVTEAYTLNPDTFPQAEGIAFAPNGDMYITNEGKFGKPVLLRFPYGQNSRK